MRLLITGAISWDEKQKRELQEMGHDLIYVKDERVPLREQNILPEMIEGTICNGLFLYNDIFDFKNLRYIQLTSAGFDRVPMEYVKKQKIEIHNARGVYSIPMAEFTISAVLFFYKHSRFFYENQKNHRWEKHRDLMELLEKTVCIIGCGSVGTECAKRFEGFGCHIIGVDKFSEESRHYQQILGLEQVDFALQKSDIVVLTLPLTKDTKYLINKDRLARMKPGSILVNIARGALVDTGALVDAMPKLGGAVLDVFEEEPLDQGSPLWSMENVLITPHNSFVGENNRERMQRVILKNLGE
ncbi:MULTISPECIES: NAD(P)-dependent oxidoreductase [Eubacteriales]|uniref:NAD(P)-dependent oxidoreductase n=1 Tax=Eubacteriales TaxID=186802 RepID=UPI001106866A|nr:MULTISPECIES: NAD(P)-dependent oxidoreductase [Eubacteriales]